MKLTGENSSRKGQVAFFDALAALLIVVLIFSVGFTITGISAERLQKARSSAVQEMKLVSLADRLVKSELAFEDSERTFANKLDLNKFGGLDLNEWKEKAGFSSLRVSVSSKSFQKSRGSGTYCVNRLVLVEGEVCVLQVCS